MFYVLFQDGISHSKLCYFALGYSGLFSSDQKIVEREAWQSLLTGVFELMSYITTRYTQIKYFLYRRRT